MQTASQLRRLRYNANNARKRDRWGEAMREHEEMLDALHRRAGGEMSEIMFRHLHNKGTAVIDYIEEPAAPGINPVGDAADASGVVPLVSSA